MRLRPGLVFHDGGPVTMQDVVASLKRWMGLDTVDCMMAVDVAAEQQEQAVEGWNLFITSVSEPAFSRCWATPSPHDLWRAELRRMGMQ